MARRSKTFYVLWTLTGLFALTLLIGYAKSGGLTTVLQALPESRLAPGGSLRFDVVGELCVAGELDGKVLQVLVSGAGYGPIYWDFPYQPDTYSYTRAALRAGYATFNFYRLGPDRHGPPRGPQGLHAADGAGG